MLYTKKLNFFIVFILLLTASTIEAKRLKNSNDYFSIVEENADRVSSKLDELNEYMAEIYKSDKFMNKNFYGYNSAWYASYDSFVTITNDYPYIRSKYKTTKTIRDIVLKYREGKSESVSIYLYISELSSKPKYLEKFLKDRLVEKKNIQLAIEEILEVEDKIKKLVKEKIVKNIIKLYEQNVYTSDLNYVSRKVEKYFKASVDHTELFKEYKDSLKYDFNYFMDKKNDKIEKVNSYSKKKKSLYISSEDAILDYWANRTSLISFKLRSTLFRIKYTSKNHLFNQKTNFIEILDEYEKKGLCKKRHHPESTDYIYEAIGKNGEYKGFIKYYNNINTGEWSAGAITSVDDLKRLKKHIERNSKVFVQSLAKYHGMIKEEIVKKYSTKVKQEFGNEF